MELIGIAIHVVLSRVQVLSCRLEIVSQNLNDEGTGRVLSLYLSDAFK